MKRTLLALLLLTACSEDPPDTAVVFRLDAEGTLHTRITEVTLRVSGAPAGGTFDQVFEEHVVTDVDSWPLVTVVAPADGETGRSLSYEALGYDGDGTELGRILVRARFVDGERITLNLEFPEGCAELACASGLSCEAVDGEPRCISPDRDLTGPSDGGVLPDGATDGAVDGGTDGGPRDGGPVDGGNPTVPRLRWPPNGHYTGSARTAAARRPTLRWDPVAGADHYEVELGRCPNGSVIECLGDFTPEVVAQAPTNTWRPAEPLEPGNTTPLGRRYAWRVRACSSDDECGPPSEARYLNVGRLRGDFDGDGRGDFAAGDSSAMIDGALQVGGVTLYQGREVVDPAGVFLTEEAPTAFAYFGRALASGDFDGDGFGDLAVGADGRCLVHWGADSGLSATSVTELDMAMNPNFGSVLASIGDVDGDGFDDFALGADEQNRVFVVRGSAERTLILSAPMLDPMALMAGTPAPFAAGDIDGNGFTDLVVGRPDMNSSLGVAYLFLSDGSAFGAARPLSHPDESEPAVSTGSRFGIAAAHGDFDGDGFEDIAISALDAGEANHGRVYVARGGRTGLADEWDRLERPTGPGTQFGHAMAAADIDGDALDDLLVGAPFAGTLGAQYGQVYVFLGSPGDPLAEADFSLLPPVTEQYAFGKALSVTDANGDGSVEPFVGAPEGNRMYLYSSDGESSLELGPAGPVDRFPTSLAP